MDSTKMDRTKMDSTKMVLMRARARQRKSPKGQRPMGLGRDCIDMGQHRLTIKEWPGKFPCRAMELRSRGGIIPGRDDKRCRDLVRTYICFDIDIGDFVQHSFALGKGVF